MIELGIVGAGDVVKRFVVPKLRTHPKIRAAAICGHRSGAAQKIAGEFENLAAFDNFDEMLQDRRLNLDAIMLCVPPGQHFSLASKALDLNLPVLIEKPFCSTLEDVDLLIEKSRKKAVPLGFTFNNYLREENRAMARRIHNNEIGDIYSIDLEWLRQKGLPAADWWRQPENAIGGCFSDLGSHLIMIALDLIKPRKCYQVVANAIHLTKEAGINRPLIEDYAAIQIQPDGGPLISIRTGWGMSLPTGSIVNFRVFGSNGSLSNHDYTGQKRDGYHEIFNRFAAAVSGQYNFDLESLRQTMALVHASYKSMRCSSTPIKIEFNQH